MSMNKTLYNKDEKFYKSKNPKISIIIATLNAERFINNTLFSIQNQNFKDVEIIVVDDYSIDNTINVVKELMEKDPRIVLFQNEENKGTLYTKTKGVLNSNGKYVMILDQDDMYTQKDAFTTLYYYAKQNNLEILGFSAIFSGKIPFDKPKYIHFYVETPIIYQPNIPSKMFRNDGAVYREGWYIWNYIFDNELFKKTIRQIDDKFMNTKMNCFEDFILFFLLTRNAKNLKQIKRVFYNQMHLTFNNTNNALLNEKRNNFNISCLSAINYIEFLLAHTNNTVHDKKIASYELENFFLNDKCRNCQFIKERGENICKLFLENEFIEDNVKMKIKNFLNEISKI